MIFALSHKIILIGLTFLMLAGFWLAPIKSQAQSAAPNQPTIERAWYGRLADWAVNVWQATVNWVIEQGSQIARAFSRQSETPVAEKPQVLGEAASSPSPVGEGRGDLSAGVAEGRAEQTQTTNPSPVRPAPTPKADHPLPAAPEPAPTTPVTTPEIIAEPEPAKTEATKPQQSSSYFIPILARDTIAPTSQITAFASASTATPGSATSSPFTVAWSGTDINITGNPIVASFDIQYQVDSGAWQDWLLETTLLTSSFTSQDEKNYGFRSRARDQGNNLEAYPDTADASIYANLSIPTTPSVTSHNSGQTLLSTTADEDLSSGSTVQVTLSGSGDIGDILTITLAETSTTATTTITSASPRWSKQFTLAEGANNFTLRTQEADGDQSSSALFLLNLEMVPTREVVINEIAWMGTTATSTADEWIELYNPGSSSVDISGWTLIASSTTPNITISAGKTIAAKSYFLLERTDDNTVSDILADQFYTGALVNGGDLLRLRKPNGLLVDKAGSTAAWFNVGDNTTKQTMERKDPSSDGTLAASWATNDGVFINGKASDNLTNIKGTPKSLNSQNTTIPRSITDLQIQYIYTTTSSFRLYWTTPKTANLATTTPASYDIRYYAQAGGNCATTLTDANFSAGTAVTGPTPSAIQSTVATITVSSLSANTAYCFAIKTNNGSETSGLSNVYTATTHSAGYGTTIAGYPVSGVIASSTSPYIVTGNIPIGNGETLTIQAGAVLKFRSNGGLCGGGRCAITVADGGTLIIGSASDSVNAAVLTSTLDDTYGGDTEGDGATSGTAGDWNQISTGGSGSVITVNHGIIRYGGFGGPMITATAGTMTIANSIIANSSNYGLAIQGDSTSLTLTNSSVQNNLEGLGISSLANANITGSTFTGNHRGIAIDATADEANLTITGNNFFANNASAGADPFAGLHYSDTGTLTATNNWWGSASGPTLISPDFDAVTDAAMATGVGGVINYASPAASAFSILPSGL